MERLWEESLRGCEVRTLFALRSPRRAGIARALPRQQVRKVWVADLR